MEPEDLSQLSYADLQDRLQQVRALKAPEPEEPPAPAAPEKEDLSKLSYPELQDRLQKVRQTHEQILSPYREQAAQTDPDTGLRWGLKKFTGAIREPLTTIAYGQARKALSEGTADESDLRQIALYEQEQERAKKESFNQSLGGAALSLPGHAATLLAGGSAARGVSGAVGLTGKGLLPAAGRLAVQAAVTPDFAPAQLVQQNVQAGRDPFDVRGLPFALAKSVAELATINAVGGAVTKAMPASGPAGRVAVQGASGPFAQGAADAVSYGLGLSTRYGSLQDLVEGKNGEAVKGAALQILNYGGLGFMHGEAEAGQKIIKEAAEKIDAGAKKGFSVTASVQSAAADAAAKAEKLHNEQAPESAPLRSQPQASQPSQPEQVQNAPGSTEPSAEPPTAQPSPQTAPEASTQDPERPFSHLSGDDVVSLAKSLGVKAKTPEALADALLKKGMSRGAVEALSDSSKPAQPDGSNSQQTGNLPESLSPERRHDLARRKAVEEMAPEEKDAAIAELRRQAVESEAENKALKTDTVTGFETGAGREKAVAKAIKTGGAYADIDIANLGGLNKAAGSNEKANAHFKAFADLIREEVGKVAPEARLIRHGGDEMSVVAPGTDPRVLEGAMARARARVQEYARANNLHEIENPKSKPESPRAKGTGIHFGVTDLRTGDNPKQVYERADTETGLMRARDVNRVTPEAPGAGAPEGQAGRAGEGPGATAPQAGAGKPGEAAGSEEEGPALAPDPAKQLAEEQAARSGRAVPLEDVFQSAGLSPKERHVVRERMLARSHEDIAADEPMTKKDGSPYTRQRVKQLEQSALKKLGLPTDFSLADVHESERTDRALDLIERGGLVNMAELSGQFDPETGKILARKAKARVDDIEARDKALDRIADAYAKEKEDAGGRLPAEREQYWADRFTRAYQGREGEPGQEEGQPASRAQAPAERGAVEPPPVRREPAGGVQGGGEAPGVPHQEPSGGPPAPAHPGGEAPAAGNAQAPGDKLSPFHRAWSKVAQEQGHDPAELHSLAKEYLDRGKAQFDPQRNDSIDEAWRLLKEHGTTPQKLRAVIKRGGDPADLPGMDEVANDLKLGDDSTHADDALAQLLMEGKRQPLKPTDAYQHALEELNDRREARRATEEAKRSGFSAQAAEEALRSGQEDGEAEGAGDAGAAAGFHVDDALPGELDFDFGANAGDGPHRDANGRPFAMGAAALGELTPDSGQVYKGNTALANKKIDAERVQEGMNPIIGSARMQNPESWDAAMKRLEADPKAGEKLIEELTRKARPADVVEQAMLLREKIRLDNEYRVLGKQLSDPNGKDLSDLSALQDRVDELGRQRYDLALAVKRTGTELGRSLQFRKQLAAEDYSLQGMLQEFRTAAGREATPEEAAKLAALQKQIEDLQGQLEAAEKAYTEGGSKVGSKEQGDMRKALVALVDAKGDVQRTFKQARDARRTPGQKMADWLLKLRVNEVISSPVTLAKIVAASAERVAISPLEEAAGAVWSNIPGIAKIAAMAPREGRGLNPVAEKQAIGDAFTKGVADSLRTLKTGRSELDVLHGKTETPRGWLDLQFSLHDAAKAPAVRAEFTRSFLKRVDAATKAGEDATSPAALLRFSAEAYKDSQGAKFRQENWLVDAYNKALSSMEKTGNPYAKATATGLKLLTPVVRVPTNLAFETLNYAFGAPVGAVRALNAVARGTENLSPKQADAIMQQLKKGSLGAAALLTGYFNPQMFGGYYSGKRKEDDVKAGAVRINGTNIPAWLQHNPLLQVFQMGATIRRAADQTVKGEKQGLGVGIGAGLAGAAEEIPFVRETGQVAGLTSSKATERGHYFGELLKSLAVPQVVQWLAGETDKKAPFNPSEQPVHRKPKGVLQTVETGVPGLRQRVPVGK